LVIERLTLYHESFSKRQSKNIYLSFPAGKYYTKAVVLRKKIVAEVGESVRGCQLTADSGNKEVMLID